MREIFQLPVLSECDVIKLRKKQFLRALKTFADAVSLANNNGGSYVIEDPYGKGEKPDELIIDGIVVSAMKGGIRKIYEELVNAREKKFARKAVRSMRNASALRRK